MALAANIHSVLLSHGIVMAAEVGTIINLFVAVSAPVMAFIGGDLFSFEQLRIASRYRAVDFEYGKALDLWSDTRQKAWNAQQTRYGANIKVAVPQPSQLPSQPVSRLISGETQGETVGDRLSQWLSQNPQGWDMSVSDLSQATGLPRSSVGREIKKLRNV